MAQLLLKLVNIGAGVLIAFLPLLALNAQASSGTMVIEKPADAPSCTVLGWRIYYNSERSQELFDLLAKLDSKQDLTMKEKNAIHDELVRIDPNMSEMRNKNVLLKVSFPNSANLTNADLLSVSISAPSQTWISDQAHLPDPLALSFTSGIQMQIPIFLIDYCFGPNLVSVDLKFKDGESLSFSGQISPDSTWKIGK